MRRLKAILLESAEELGYLSVLRLLPSLDPRPPTTVDGGLSSNCIENVGFVGFAPLDCSMQQRMEM